MTTMTAPPRPRSTPLPHPTDPGRLHLSRTLLLVQAGIIAMSVVESSVVGAASPNMVSLALVNVIALAWTLLLRRALGRGSERARRWIRRIELAWMITAVIDIGFSLALAQRLELVPIATRLVLPWAIRRLTRTPMTTTPRPPAPTPYAPPPTHGRDPYPRTAMGHPRARRWPIPVQGSVTSRSEVGR